MEITEKMRDILTNLKNGKQIDLRHRRNQYGDDVAVEWLEFLNGQWTLTWVQCLSSMEYGFGTCQCNSHRPETTEVITRERALELINDYVADQDAEAAERAAESQWLEEVTTA